MTEREAIEAGMSENDIALGVMFEEIEPTELPPAPHGKVVARRFEPYHNVTVYEDGHEDWFYIGDYIKPKRPDLAVVPEVVVRYLMMADHRKEGAKRCNMSIRNFGERLLKFTAVKKNLLLL